MTEIYINGTEKFIFYFNEFINDLKKIDINDITSLHAAMDSWLNKEPFGKFNENEKQHVIKKLCIYFVKDFRTVNDNKDYLHIDDLFNKLIKLGADVEEKDEEGRSIISYAVETGSKKLTYFLSSLGASLNEKDLEHFNLPNEKKMNNSEKIEYLLEEKTFCNLDDPLIGAYTVMGTIDKTSKIAKINNNFGSIFCVSKESALINSDSVSSIGHSYIRGVKALLLNTPKLKLNNDATLEARGDLFLFNVDSVECVNSAILSHRTIYFNNGAKFVLDNCIMSESIKYISKSNYRFVCDEEHFVSEPLLSDYCENFRTKYLPEEL